jgi:acetylornithine deacetylase/succinyl-diaminopimelate desuccinylase-like protein
VNKLKDSLGQPSLIICLDSGCADYQRLWVSTNLRGVMSIDLKVSILKGAIHSGVAGGLIPDSFMIARQLLDRIENPDTGDLLEKSLFVKLPAQREKQIDKMITVVGDKYLKNIPWFGNTQPLDSNLKDTIIRNTWKPTLVVLGANGFPDIVSGGNVIRPYTELKLSIRIPPGVDSVMAAAKIKETLEKEPPYNATVVAEIVNTGDGWNLSSFSERLENILSISSERFFNNEMCFVGEGGSVPFVKLFNDLFPQSDFAVLGVCGPTSNIHGPDENLDLNYVQRLMMCLTYLISEY